MARKINVKLILELHDAGMSRNAIASTRHISRHSVSEVIHLAEDNGISYKDVQDMEDNDVYRLIYPDKYQVETLYDKPDYDYVHQELKRTGVTLKLLWQEYRDRCIQNNVIPMGYTKFCDGYRNTL